MKNKITYAIIFVLSLICLYTSLKTFYNLAIYVDEANTSLDVVLGGDLCLLMNWLKFGLLAVISILSGLKMIQK